MENPHGCATQRCLVIIYIAVRGTFVCSETSDFALWYIPGPTTTAGPVSDAKNICIFDSSEHDDKELPVDEPPVLIMRERNDGGFAVN